MHLSPQSEKYRTEKSFLDSAVKSKAQATIKKLYVNENYFLSEAGVILYLQRKRTGVSKSG